MFDSKYYKKRFVYKHDTGDLSLLEMNYSRKEAYIFLVDKEDSSKIDIYLRRLDYNPIEVENLIPLKDFLIQHGYSNEEFSNRLTRTRKIINEIDKINESKEEEKVLKK